MTIYCDTDTCAYHIDLLGLSYTRDINRFMSETPQIAVFHVPFPYDQSYGRAFEERVNLVYDKCEQIIILCSELHQRTVDFIQRHDRPKIVYFICGYLNRRPEHSRVYQWFDWFITTGDFYKRNIHVLDTLVSTQSKNKTFDILLGQPRYHRDEIYCYIKNNNLDNNVIMTYLRDLTKNMSEQNFHAKTLQERTANEWVWDKDTLLELPNEAIHFTITRVLYHNESLSISQIIPIDIYNQTAYTIVAETNFVNNYSFFTEKVVKPILAKRLFLVFSGQHYLRNLHNAGFKTFDGIIDESYDEEPDIKLRYQMIFEQMQFLFEQPQEEILAKIKPIVEHNHHLMMTTDWLRQFHINLRTVLIETK